MMLWQSVPFACILLALGSAAVTGVLRGRAARCWTLAVLGVETAASAVLAALVAQSGTYYTYMMGHFPAPWGNELRVGLTEALLGCGFSLVMLLSLAGGLRELEEDVSSCRHSLYYVMILLLQASLQAQIYTNDIFTGYVFAEIMTIAAAASIAVSDRGRNLLAATRYMIMNLIGSALFLLGVILLYDLTGHLLMSPLRNAVSALYAGGEYRVPMTVVPALIFVGLGVKSALFPFHTWVPDAYGCSTPASAAILSSLVSKGYIVLLIKIAVRVLGTDVIRGTGADDVIFGFGVAGMVMGSVLAIRQTDVRRMTAYSSVAQIGYIYMGMGLNTEAGITAALFHILAHAACKGMLFIALGTLADVSGGSSRFDALKGAGKRAPLAGAAFTVGALSMTGFPFLGGFPSKMNFVLAGLDYGGTHLWIVLAAVVVSTALNAVYFLRTVIALYGKPAEGGSLAVSEKNGFARAASLSCFMALNIGLGLAFHPVMEWLRQGLATLG